MVEETQQKQYVKNYGLIRLIYLAQLDHAFQNKLEWSEQAADLPL